MIRPGAGELDRRVTFRRHPAAPAAALDEFGQPVGIEDDPGTWTEIAQAWAKVTPMRDAERLRAGQVEARSAAWFVVRWTADLAAVTARDVIEHAGVTWTIGGIKELGRRAFLEFTAELSDAQG